MCQTDSIPPTEEKIRSIMNAKAKGKDRVTPQLRSLPRLRAKWCEKTVLEMQQRGNPEKKGTEWKKYAETRMLGVCDPQNLDSEPQPRVPRGTKKSKG